MTLTEKQAGALREVATKGVKWVLRGHGAWRINGEFHGGIYAALRKKGLITFGFPGKAELTDAGRAWLAENAAEVTDG